MRPISVTASVACSAVISRARSRFHATLVTSATMS